MGGQRRGLGALRRGRATHGLWGLAAIALVVVLGWSHGARLRRASAAPSWVDPLSARLLSMPAWTDPRWIERLRETLRGEPPFALDDAATRERLCRELGRLSFVRSARCEFRGGLRIELALRVPVACIRSGGAYLLVAEDGVLLEGSWPLPPRLGRTFLPVVGTLGDRLFRRPRPGDWLAEPEHADALEVALSMWAHLSPDERATLGRLVIDARASRAASVSVPGVELALEGERRALYGRPGGSDQPGELPAALKWRALERALELQRRDPLGCDWERVDLRWDRPELALRRPPGEPRLAARTPGAESPRTSTRVTRPAEDTRPHVR